MWAIASLSPSASRRAGVRIHLTERRAARRAPAVIALLASFLLVACGGGDDGLASDRALATREAVAEQAVIRYASPTGEVVLAVINAFADAGAVVVTDFAVQQPGGLVGFTGAGVASFEVLSAEPLPGESLPGTIGSSARWRVRTDEVEFWDDVLAFRRGTVWVFLQGISPEAGGTPVVDLGLLIDGILL